MLNHLANNYVSINYYLDYVDSVVVSSDLTKDEIIEIHDKSKKKLVINVFGLNNLMYSRRKLITNYNEYYHENLKNEANASINDLGFIIFENEYGTVMYANKYYDALELLECKNVLYYWYNPVFLDNDKILQVVLNNNLDNIDTYKGFLNKKTIYKLRAGDKND